MNNNHGIISEPIKRSETILEIEGGHPLHGDVYIKGAKNAMLPLLPLTLLTDETVEFSNIPLLSDMVTMRDLLKILGADIIQHDDTMRLTTSRILSYEAPYELVSKMRASIIVMGPLLARCGTAKISLPGGCAIGARSIDLHLKAFEQMGVNIILEGGYVHARAQKGLKGAEIYLDFPSVGATENIMGAAVLAHGTTIIHHPAKEPEIIDMANCLNSMGAKITGAGTDTIIIDGVTKLHTVKHHIIADRLEAASYAIAAAVSGGAITLHNLHNDIFKDIAAYFDQAGIQVTMKNQDNHISAHIKMADSGLKPTNITTAPFPGFPTDMQAQWMAMSLFADGETKIHETIFENRFMHVNELRRMGADIKLDNHKATVMGNSYLTGCELMATDIRASFGLIIAALKATKITTIHRLHHCERGYEKIYEKLLAIGANINLSQKAI